MNDFRAINARDLKRQFFSGTPAEEGWTRLTAGEFRPGELGRLLRHHNMASVSNPAEIHFRDCVDTLLDYCGLLEVALHAGYISTEGDDEFWSTLATLLSREEVRRFYADYYPQVLPQLLRERLQGAPHLPIDAPTSLTLEFLSHSRRQQRDSDLDRFFRLMDSFLFGKLTPQTFVSIVKDPALVAKHLLDPDLADDTVSQALRGFDKMIVFVAAFDGTLVRCTEWPSLAARMWEYFGYWFRAMRQTFGDGLLDAIQAIESWDMGSAAPEEREQQAAYVRDVKAAVVRVVYRPTPELPTS